MEIEREQRRTPTQPAHTPHARPSKGPAGTDVRPQTTTAKFERVNYAREVSYAVGVIFVAIGLIGFVVDNLLGAHLSYAHNWIHLLSGLAAIICAYDSRKSARNFAIGFGAIYGLLGILGFVLGAPGEATVGHVGRDSSLWVLSPNVLEFGSSDHIIHLIFAGVLIAAAMMHYQRRTDAGAMY